MNFEPVKMAFVRGVDLSGAKWPGEDGTRFGVTGILFHAFFGHSEPKPKGVERLRRLCEWIRAELHPIDMAEYLRASRDGVVPERAVFVTFDDAKSTILDCLDVFREFEIPITIFPSCGCLREHDAADDDMALARAAFLMDRYTQGRRDLRMDNGEQVVLGGGDRATEVDHLLSMAEGDPGIGRELLTRLEELGKDTQASASVCSWRELKEIEGNLVSIGSHSMTHCRLAGKSARRLAFEIEASRRLIQKHFSACDMFAYPYGTWDVVNPETTRAIGHAGYEAAFLVAGGYGRAPDRYTIPRVDIPDAEIDFPVLGSLIKGGRIPLIMLKNLLKSHGR
jgi:peptidoglycan/xylan/chitin deacetylase (PgdA/CDA1 family)